MSRRSTRFVFAPVVLAAAFGALDARGGAAQARGLPLFLEPTWSYHGRAGVDVGHGGELDGLTLVASGSWLPFPRFVGNCRKLALSAAAGIHNPPGSAATGLSAGVAVSWLLHPIRLWAEPCPRPNSRVNPTLRVMTGADLLRIDEIESDDTRVAMSWMPIGLGLGYMLQMPVVKIEIWTTPRLVYRESLRPGEDSDWGGAFSLGVTLGLGGVAGLRAAADCCAGGIGGGYGLSVWF